MTGVRGSTLTPSSVRAHPPSSFWSELCRGTPGSNPTRTKTSQSAGSAGERDPWRGGAPALGIGRGRATPRGGPKVESGRSGDVERRVRVDRDRLGDDAELVDA